MNRQMTRLILSLLLAQSPNGWICHTAAHIKVAEWRSGYGLGFRTKGSLVRTPAGAHFVVALSKSHLPCLVLVEPRKRWTDDQLRQTVTRLETTLCLMC